MKAQKADMAVCPMRSPLDTSAVEQLFASGRVRADSVVALVGKTEGTGLHDDYGRVLADLRLREILGSHLAIPRDDVAERVSIILSGGCFGVITPHVTVITREWIDVPESALPKDGRLVVGRSHSEPILAEEIGRVGQVDKVATAVRQAMEDADIAHPADVHAVMVKAPSLSWASIREAEARGQTVVTYDLTTGEHGAICYANDGSALGVAVALGEVGRAQLSDEVVRRDWNLYSRVAATSSGGEKRRAEVLVMGNTAAAIGSLRIGHGIIRDVIDTEGIKEALRSAGLAFVCCPGPQEQAHIVQIFAKLIVPGSDMVRGNRITMLDDHEAYRSSKAVGGTLVASVAGTTTVFVSGGEKNSHQGPPGGSPVAAVVRLEA